MFENIINFFKKITKKSEAVPANSKEAAKERLHLVLMQDRANVSADFLELMKQEIIEVIKKYIDVDESAIDVRLTNKENSDGTNGAPALYANIPILNIKNEARKMEKTVNNNNEKKEEKQSNNPVETNKEKIQENKESEKSKAEDKKEDKKEEKKDKTENKKEEEIQSNKQQEEKNQKEKTEKDTAKKETKEKLKSEN